MEEILNIKNILEATFIFLVGVIVAVRKELLSWITYKLSRFRKRSVDVKTKQANSTLVSFGILLILSIYTVFIIFKAPFLQTVSFFWLLKVLSIASVLCILLMFLHYNETIRVNYLGIIYQLNILFVGLLIILTTIAIFLKFILIQHYWVAGSGGFISLVETVALIAFFSFCIRLKPKGFIAATSRKKLIGYSFYLILAIFTAATFYIPTTVYPKGNSSFVEKFVKPTDSLYYDFIRLKESK